MKKVLLEGLLIAVIGSLLAFCGNALSPRGISLSQDFFPSKKVAANANGAPSLAVSNAHIASSTSQTASSEWEDLAARVQAQGLTLINGQRALELFNDPRRQQNLVVFIDARHDEEYHAGHIPGAYQFDYYYADKFLNTIVPLSQTAQQIIVYCAGGHCEDSLNAAMTLANFVPKEKLMVYGGGINEWTAQGREVETGERNSGTLRKGKQ